MTFLLGHHPFVGIALGVMLVITGTLGDLVESQVKRDLGIKDMGTLLPGHGGIMDRLDSLLPSAVATWIVLTLFI
ncbi:Phosphatidate cytidylyltransferase (CdsA) [Mycobacteroides abscessus]|nr:Phosphatidate cytidylyltransferase (CdsA) [Mycobacteroides abscessus]